MTEREIHELKQPTCGVEFSQSTTSGREAYKAWGTSEASPEEMERAWAAARELRRRALEELAEKVCCHADSDHPSHSFSDCLEAVCNDPDHCHFVHPSLDDCEQALKEGARP